MRLWVRVPYPVPAGKRHYTRLAQGLAYVSLICASGQVMIIRSVIVGLEIPVPYNIYSREWLKRSEVDTHSLWPFKDSLRGCVE